MDYPTVVELEQRFGASGRTRFRDGPGGLPIAEVSNGRGSVEFSLHGGHVLSYRPAGCDPVLFVSRASTYAPGKPIRGGVPVCWPWFGAHPGDPSQPMHGFARLLCWTLDAIQESPESTEILLRLASDDRTRGYWKHAFVLDLRIVLGAGLRLELTTRNTGDCAFTVSQALHTYFAVGEITDVAIQGLEGSGYHDSLTGVANPATQEPLAIRGEVDRVYLDTTAPCVIADARLGRRIRVGKSGSRSTVVWNPWIDKSKRMPDFGDDEYHQMLCIETANARDDARTVGPGQAHTLVQTMHVEPVR